MKWASILTILVASSGCQLVTGAAALEIDGHGADWTCLGRGSPIFRETVSEETGPPLVVERVVRNLASNAAVQGLMARQCGWHDDPCSAKFTTFEDGVLRFEFDRSFNGYLELQAPSMVPGIVEFTRPIGDMRVLPELRMVDPLSLSAFAVRVNAVLDGALGHAMYWAEDCVGQRAADVTVRPLGDDLLPSTRAYYVIDAKSPSLTVNRTEASGGGGFVNLPVSGEQTTLRTFDAVLSSTQQPISRFSARIRAGHVTFFVIEPD